MDVAERVGRASDAAKWVSEHPDECKPMEIALTLWRTSETTWQAKATGPDPARPGNSIDWHAVGSSPAGALSRLGAALPLFASWEENSNGGKAGREGEVMQDRQEGPVPAELCQVAQAVDRLMPQGPHIGVLLPGLAPHQQRVVQESVDLHDNLTKLMAFTSGPVFAGLPEAERMLLLRQQAAMADYAFVLATRIQRFQPAVADSEGGEV